ncbi:MAG TPA: isoprenyl transferase [Caldithrix abyssi]|uniref:Isoprenyl transferase n=1 Tax=Caldithrix abyssi TaxID=187145 RepID=A0A7V4WWV2_CALAY|nr:isoprenyl transferase [Caldithrix abyssi]
MDYQDKLEKLKQTSNLPRHIGIIMDGNGRWAKKRGLPRVAGHNEGVNSVHDIVEVCGELGIRVLTIYTFSEENWKRPSWEVAALMQLLVTTIDKHINRLMEQNVQIRTIGHLNKLPAQTQKKMLEAVERTKNNTGLILNVALSYGGRQEIVDAVKRLGRRIKEGKLHPDEISDHTLSDQLDTAGQPDPDLVIRTGGEFRISNFLLWQIAYAELYITKTSWPDFRKPQLVDALWDYIHRERRYGKVSEQIQPETALQNA